MKYNLIGINDYVANPLETVLNNRGIKDIEAFTNVSKANTHSYNLLENIDKATDKIIEHLEKDSAIHVEVDVDCDGVTSSALFANYIYRIYPKAKLVFHMNDGKIHGVKSENITDEIDLVVAIDSSTNDYDEHKKLFDRGIDVVILDHHPSSGGYSDHAIVVNNQMCDYPNKDFSGVGIAYKTCQALDNRLGVNYANDYLDLVAVGNIADLMNLTSLETRYYVLEGLKPENIKNPLLIELIKKQEFVTKGLINVKTIGWNISPLINATIRVGKQEERMNMFKAMLENCNETLPYKKRGQEETIDQSLAEAMARICGNVKGRQDRARDKSVKILEDIIEEVGLSDENLLAVDATDILDKSLSGLVAIHLAQKYKRPTLILHETEHKNEDGTKTMVYNGSGRNFNNSPIEDFKGLLNDLSLFNYVEGHNQAFGVEIPQERLCEVKDKTDILLQDIDFNENYVVDFVIPANQLKTQFIKTIASNGNLWGKGVECPEVVIKDICLNKSEISIVGKKEDTVKFVVRGVEFVKFRTPNALEDMPDNIKLTVVGVCEINDWKGVETPQFEIRDWEFADNKEDILSMF